jgi:hypothetical protein
MNVKPISQTLARPTALRRLTWLLLASLLLLSLIGVQPAHAAGTIVVSGTCSLIDAITAANTDTATGGCPAGAGADTIELEADVTYTLDIVNNSSVEQGGDNGLPRINSEIVINGNGATIARDPSAPLFRLFEVEATGDLTLNDVTLQGGDAGASSYVPGAIGSDGNVTLNRTVFTQNRNAVNVYFPGVLMVKDTTMYDNYGNFAISAYDATISYSTISKNSGTGIQNYTLSLSHSTVSGNTSGVRFANGLIDNSTVSGNESGITVLNYYNEVVNATIQDSTVTGNTAGGIIITNFYLDASNVTLNLKQTLVAGNTGNGSAHEIDNQLGGVIVADNYNLIGTDGNANSLGFTPSGTDLVPSESLADILDTALQDNGGATLTHALVGNSPALDAIPASDCATTTDQRDVSRPQGASCDIGAFELVDSTPPVITPNVSGTLGGNGWYTSDVQVSWTVSDDESAITSTNGCDATSINSDTTGTTLSCEATSYGGTKSVSVTIKRDATAPTASASTSGTPGNNGWYVSDVTVSFSGSDALSGIASCDADVILSSDGAGQSTSGVCTDNAGNVSATATASGINIDKTAPVVSVTGVSDGATYTLGSVPTADCDTTDALSGVDTEASLSLSGGNPDGSGTITATCDGALDNAGNSGSASVTYMEIIPNTAPTADPGGPYLGAVNTTVQFDGSASSDPETDSLTYAWDFGDSSSGEGVMPSHSYADAGVYTVCLTVNDGALSSEANCTMAVVYDPSAGFVTGGGWIDSPAGAYTADPSLSGKATFGFVSKYKKGASVPTGTTAFAFDMAGFEFYSDNYEWLVVNKSGINAQFKGSGTVNAALDPNGNPYKFMLWAGDGSPDTFRIRIWWEDTSGAENVVYDNGSDQPINAGNIVVHKSK